MAHGHMQLPQMPHQWINSEGLSLRLQAFLIVRDEKRRVATVRLKEYPPGVFALPAETVRANENIHAAGSRVSESWFGTDLKPRVADVLTWPSDGQSHWYVLFVFEADAPKGGLPVLPDTAEIVFRDADSPPDAFAFDHGSVWERLAR